MLSQRPMPPALPYLRKPHRVSLSNQHTFRTNTHNVTCWRSQVRRRPPVAYCCDCRPLDIALEARHFRLRQRCAVRAPLRIPPQPPFVRGVGRNPFELLFPMNCPAPARRVSSSLSTAALQIRRQQQPQRPDQGPAAFMGVQASWRAPRVSPTA